MHKMNLIVFNLSEIDDEEPKENALEMVKGIIFRVIELVILKCIGDVFGT
ncbi:hypothetical protein MKMG_00637 [Methanogenium sp. MK-MG]|nr:hypothetical protein MKMG_00637 [Methanogenium sp. MK-MG]